MAMSGSRTMLYFMGIILVVIAIGVFFFAADLNRWVPVSMLAAGILLIIGLSVMGFADRAPSETTRRDVHEGTGGDVTVIKK